MSINESPLPEQKPSQWSLFGIDPRTLGQDWLRALTLLNRYPPLKWLEKEPVVQVLRADQSLALWDGEKLHPQSGSAGKAAGEGGEPPQAYAVELPEDLILRRSLTLPRLPQQQIMDAVWLDISNSNPFAEEDVVWGFAQQPEGEYLRLDAAMASHAQIGNYLQQVQTRRKDWPVAQSEVWALGGSGTPIVFTGFAEHVRQDLINRRRGKNWLMLGALALLLGAVLVTPTLQLRSKALQADDAYNRLVEQAAEATAERDAFTRMMEDLEVVKTAQASRVNALEVLNQLTRSLPADVSINNFRLEQGKVELSATADNAAAIMQLLGDMDEFSEVSSSGAVTRNPIVDKENFSVELTVASSAFNKLYHAKPSVDFNPAAAAAGQNMGAAMGDALQAQPVPAQGDPMSVMGAGRAQRPDMPAVPQGPAMGGPGVTPQTTTPIVPLPDVAPMPDTLPDAEPDPFTIGGVPIEPQVEQPAAQDPPDMLEPGQELLQEFSNMSAPQNGGMQ